MTNCAAGCGRHHRARVFVLEALRPLRKGVETLKGIGIEQLGARAWMRHFGRGGNWLLCLSVRGFHGDMHALCHDGRVASAVLAEMAKEGRASGLRGFEQVAMGGLSSTCLSARPPASAFCPSFRPSVRLSVYLSICPSVCPHHAWGPTPSHHK
jgi:hypothetical protein